MRLTIDIVADDEGGLVKALGSVMEQLREGDFSSGFDQRDDDSYCKWEVTGE